LNSKRLEKKWMSCETCFIANASLPLASLLPLRAAAITLRFTAPSSLHFSHPPALTAFLRTLLGSPVDYDIHLTLALLPQLELKKSVSY
jgi:hypothetical protein